MLIATLILTLLAMALITLRAIIGPSIHDRILAANIFGSQTIALICIFAVTISNPLYIDIALVYALVNFLATLGYLKYARSNTRLGTANRSE